MRAPIRAVWFLASVAAAAALVTLILVDASPRAPRRDALPGVRALAAARDLIARGDVRGAVAHADLALAALPGSADAAAVSALARAAAGDVPGALVRIESAARAAPDDAAAALSAGLVARFLARRCREPGALAARARRWFDEAVRRADAGPRAGPGAFDAGVAAAVARLAAGGAADARRRAGALVPGTDSEREQAAVVLAAALAAVGDLDGAARALGAACAADRPPTPRVAAAAARLEALRATSAAPFAAGLAAWRRGDLPAAADALGRHADARPDDLAALRVLAAALARLGRDDQVARRIDALAAARPGGPHVAWFRGAHLLASDRFDEARPAFAAAEHAAPGDARIRRGRADAWLAALDAGRRGGFATAVVRDAERAAADEPHDPVPWFVLGCAAEMDGDAVRAETLYRRSRAADPAFGLAANNLAWVVAVRRRDPAAALPHAEDAVRLVPASAQARDTRGWVRYLAGDAVGAEADLAAARHGLPCDAAVALRHACALAAVGRSSDARSALRAAAAADPSVRSDPLYVEAESRADAEAGR